MGSMGVGSDAHSRDGSSGVSDVCLSISSSASSPENGGRPVSIS